MKEMCGTNPEMVDFGKCQLLELAHNREQCLGVDNWFVMHPEQENHGTAH